MFNENDRVVVKETGAFGTVLETYDDMVCVELDNSVEMEYKAVQLITQDEFNRQEDAQVEGVMVDRGLISMADIPYTPRRGDGRSASNVISMIRRLYPDLLTTAEEKAEQKISDDLDRVRALTNFTNTPIVVWLGAGEMSDEGMVRKVLARTILNNAIEGTILLGDILISKCRRELAAYKPSSEEK